MSRYTHFTKLKHLIFLNGGSSLERCSRQRYCWDSCSRQEYRVVQLRKDETKSGEIENLFEMYLLKRVEKLENVYCRTIERGMTEYDGCIIEPRGQVYIDVQGASWSARQNTRSPISIVNYCISSAEYISNSPRSRSVVNNINNVDDRTGDKSK
jgi:hypothetical protein